MASEPHIKRIKHSLASQIRNGSIELCLCEGRKKVDKGKRRKHDKPEGTVFTDNRMQDSKQVVRHGNQKQDSGFTIGPKTFVK
jgi:hypothetical protein